MAGIARTAGASIVVFALLLLFVGVGVLLLVEAAGFGFLRPFVGGGGGGGEGSATSGFGGGAPGARGALYISVGCRLLGARPMSERLLPRAAIGDSVSKFKFLSFSPDSTNASSQASKQAFCLSQGVVKGINSWFI